MSGLAAPVNVSWTPPAASDWHFTNSTETCAAASKWTGALIVAISVYDEQGNRPVPMSYSVEYLKTILPPDLQEQPDDAQLALWYYTSDLDNDTSQDFWETFTTFSLTNCSTQICSKINWEEDPDIAGVGMLISYYTVAILTTIYYIVLLIPTPEGENRYNPKHLTLTGLLSNFLEAFQKSVNKFLLADLIFTVGMLGAALSRFYTASHHSTSTYRIFDLLTSFFMSCFSVLSCLVLQTVAAPKKRKETRARHLYRWNLALPWVAVVPMALALFVLHFPEYPKMVGHASDKSLAMLDRDAQFSEWVWVRLCDPSEFRKVLEIVLYVGLAVLAANAIWFAAYLAHKVFRWWRVRGTQEGDRSRVHQALRLLDGLGCGILMWAFVVLFHIYRDWSHEMAEDSITHWNSDGGSKEWSFGQILALAAWVPTLIELCNKIFLTPLVDLYHRHSSYQKEMDEVELSERSQTSGEVASVEVRFPL
ncbi:hypothetical protein KJ359_002061 [Pestalotiopsis sp. 9143b]|nr:hypothetical protein KJ359_002061 [Pestalotiopsis sp. 9143b]